MCNPDSAKNVHSNTACIGTAIRYACQLILNEPHPVRIIIH